MTRPAIHLSSLLHTARMITAAALIVVMTVGLTNCNNSNDLWNEVPQDIASFIDRYFPSSKLDSYVHSGTNYHVRIDDGPGLTFDASYSWIAIDGYGMPMPQVLLFDQLPPKLYEYLQGTQQLNSVFSMERDSEYYTLTLLDSSLRYTIETGEMTSHVPSASA